jgi:hypothetical protein
MTSDQWLYRQKVIAGDTSDFDSFRNALWNLLIPNFTDMGAREFQQLNAMISEKLL